MLARRAAAKVLARDEDAGVLVLGLVERLVRNLLAGSAVEADGLEQELAETGALDRLPESASEGGTRRTLRCFA